MSNYHYTKAVHLPAIVNEGKIRTTIITGEKKERSAVWLTTSEEWEICCSIAKLERDGSTTPFGLEEMKQTLGVCRIKVSDKLETTTYAKFKHVGKVSESSIDYFTDYFNKAGCKTNLWSCVFKPITEEYFESIEMMVGNEWVQWDGSISIEEFVDICHSCNSTNEIPRIEALSPETMGQLEFFLHNQLEIIETWESESNNKKGYLEMYVEEDYKTCSIRFNENNFKESDFKHTCKISDSSDMYLHMFWKSNKTQFKIAIAYDSNNKELILV